MSINRALAMRSLLPAVAILLISGCSNPGGGASSAAAIPFSTDTSTAQALLTDALDTAVVKSGVYVSMTSQTNLYALPNVQNRGAVCTLATNSTKGIAVDRSGTLWVTNLATQKITTFSKGTCTPAPLTLTDPDGVPNDVAFSPNRVVYVANITGPGGAGPGVVSVYKPGTSAPSSVLNNPEVTLLRGIAVDNTGNVFVSCVKEQKSCILEFKSGKMPGIFLNVQVGISDGLEFDAHQNLLVVDPGLRVVASFAPPYQGAPNSTFRTRGSSEFAKVDALNHNIYVSNFSSGSLDVFTYPSGSYEYSITNGLTQANSVTGVAVDPSSPN